MQRPAGYFTTRWRSRPSRRRSRASTLSSTARLSLETLEERRLLSVTAPPADLNPSPASSPISSALVSPAATTPGTWTTLSTPIPDAGGAQVPLLLSDGTVMVQGGNNSVSNLWYRLTPDSTGSYINGTWSQLASSSIERLFFPAQILPSGKAFILGGEYSNPNPGPGQVANTAEIYDPVTNTWTNAASFPQDNFGDDPTEMLPDGRVLAGYIIGPQTYIYDPATDTWSPGGTKLRNDQSDEETWLKLPDGSILSYDIFGSNADGIGHSQRYVPEQNAWVDAGTLPFQLSSPDVGFELGPAFMVPDGRAFFLGGNGKTAFYTPATNSWTAGPDIPDGMTCADAPGAMMPNGHILFAASPLGTLDANGVYTFPPPTKFFEFDPVTATYTDVTPTGVDLNTNAFLLTMVVLPTGQVMLTSESHETAIYTPSGTPEQAWRPTISDVTFDNGTFTLTGTQLNGLSEGAAYGDDNEMSSNYPIIQLQNASGNVFYARSFNWSSTGIATGDTPVSVDFTIPASVPGGAYSLKVIANGIASDAVNVNLGAFTVPDVSKLEGDSGLTQFVFTVTQPASINATAVAYSTADGTAQAGSDYIPVSGTLTFQPGETSQQVTVNVVGDLAVEPDETFYLVTSDPQNPQLLPHAPPARSSTTTSTSRSTMSPFSKAIRARRMPCSRSWSMA